MKKIFFILSLVVASLTGVIAQQVPLYSQFFDAPVIYNPARTGDDGRYNLNFIYRRQMAGFKDGPETKAGTFEMPLISNRNGIGAYYFNDATSIFRRNGGYISYAYHIQFNKENNHHLSIGLAAGVQSVRINFDQASVIDQTDPLIANGRTRNTFFDANFGVNYFWKGLNVGISVPQILGVDLHYLNDNGNRGYSPRRQYMATASYDVKLLKGGKDSTARLTITPLVLFRTTEALDWQVEGGVRVMYKDWVWISGMYRYNYGLTVGAGVKVHDMVKVGYAYDHSFNDLKSYTNGNHEIVIGLTFRTKKKEIPDSLLAKINKNDSILKQLTTKVDTMTMKQDSMAGKIDSLGHRVDTLQKQVDLLNHSMDSLNTIFGDPADSTSVRNSLKKLDKGKLNDLMNKMNELDEKYKDVEKGAGTNAKDKAVKDKKGKNKKGGELTDEEKEAKEKADKEKADKKKKNKKDKTDADTEAEMQEHKTRVVDEKDLEFKHGTPMGDYFMVVGSFRIESNSSKLEAQLNKENLKPGVVYDKKRKWYYVYLSKPEDREKGLEELYKLREENPRFHDAWIHIMSKAVK